MSLAFARALLPVVALTIGTALGIRGLAPGHPVEDASASSPSPPNLAPPTTIDPSLLPDPGPWPPLNPECSLRKAWLIAEGPAPAPHDGRRYVTLTFDDGPRPETTPAILKLLREHHVQATFFFIGRYLDGDKLKAVQSRAIAKDAVDQGHLVGSHTYDHARLVGALTPNQALDQIDDGMVAVAHATGKDPFVFRPPYGQLDELTEAHLRARGQQLVLWSIEAMDMRSSDEEQMAATLEDQLDYAGGGIVLLHDVRRPTVGVLAKLLDWLEARRFDPARPGRTGFVVTDLMTYLKETEARPQPYADRSALEAARAAAYRREHPAPAVLAGDDEPY